ncbi:MAG TPA: 4-hydroxyphenylacetate 3-hydroxylase N-terminal domain-containing protein, partial [Syntrophales bacterium]|nr:4-hydroxyphenylacetate 3-hydroxylase N-terminal domain-containing protein [Syntrophales bacterium]
NHSRDSIARTYEMAHMPEYEQIMVAISHITGSRINRFNHISQDIDDLIKRVQLNSLFNGNNGHCFQRTLGMNTLHTLSITTGDIDAASGTHHHERFLGYLRYIQENDLTCDGSLVDPGQHRSLPPHRHPNADLLLHAVGETANGVILRGVKACGLSALNSHEIVIVPTAAMTEQDEAYAVFFAVPTDAEGLTFIIDPTSLITATPGNDLAARAAEAFRNHEVLCVFDDALVPWERVFLYREFEFSEQMADMHRFSFCFDT